MQRVNITLNLDPEFINQKLNKVREFKELYLMWCIDGRSPADSPEDMLDILRDIDAIDQHFLMLEKKIYNQQNRLKGEEINYPEVE